MKGDFSGILSGPQERHSAPVNTRSAWEHIAGRVGRTVGTGTAVMEALDGSRSRRSRGGVAAGENRGRGGGGGRGRGGGAGEVLAATVAVVVAVAVITRIIDAFTTTEHRHNCYFFSKVAESS